LAPLAATVLNVSSDHLDRHHDLHAYITAKQRVYHRAHTMLFNRDDAVTRPVSASSADGLVLSFGLDAPLEGHWGLIHEDASTYLAFGSQTIMPVDELKIKGRHNWTNALAACALAQVAGIAIETMVEVLRSFTGLYHRAQWIRSIEGVDWIDDSKGTNIGATSSAISGIGGGIQGKIVLIAGGQGKGADFNELRASVAQHVSLMILIGEDAPLLQQALADVVSIERASSLEDAVQQAHQQAKQGDVVLLSPACASFDMFRDYNHRGEVFISAVQAL
jgi:UDP-N-acetylmuramoylalanine--D-glutamate ligase